MQTNNNKTPVAPQFDGVNALLAVAAATVAIESNNTPNDRSTFPSTPNATLLQTPVDDHLKASASKKGAAAAVDILKGTDKGSAAGHGGEYLSNRVHYIK